MKQIIFEISAAVAMLSFGVFEIHNARATHAFLGGLGGGISLGACLRSIGARLSKGNGR